MSSWYEFFRHQLNPRRQEEGTEDRSGAASSAVHERPWRQMTWGAQADMERNLREFRIKNPEIKKLRILLYGPVGVGKSSFINSVSTVFTKQISTGAIAQNMNANENRNETASFTLQYRTHIIENSCGDDDFAFVFNDLMGMEDAGNQGIQTADVILAMKGHVRENYKFNPLSPLQEGDPGYRRDPGLNDRAHCLVCVLDASRASLILKPDQQNTTREDGGNIIKNMRTIRREASNLGIPQFIILTKVDESCPAVKENQKMIYHSKDIEKKMKQCSMMIGVPLNCMYPVQNYSQEIETNPDVDELILKALTAIVNAANAYTSDLGNRRNM